MKKTFQSFLTLFVLAVLALSACRSKESTIGLPGTTWKLVSYGGVTNPSRAIVEIETTLTFDKNGKMGGNMGCNSF